MPIPEYFLELLQCPVTKKQLQASKNGLEAENSGRYYPMSSTDIPLFAEQYCSEDAVRQREHYERIAPEYLTNLGYANTQEYMR